MGLCTRYMLQSEISDHYDNLGRRGILIPEARLTNPIIKDHGSTIYSGHQPVRSINTK